MSIGQELRDLDERVVGRRVREMTRTTVLRIGIGFGIFAAAWYIASYWDDSLGRFAASMALFAGIFLGRVQEHDLADKGCGLKRDREQLSFSARARAGV